MKSAVHLTIEFESPLHHGNGDGVAGILDRAFSRDLNGVPFLSASAIKGKLRFGALRWLRSTSPTELCWKPDEEDKPCRDKPCQWCQLFGSPRRQGKAIFSDAFPKDREWFQTLYEQSPTMLLSSPAQIKSTTAISRKLQLAEPHHLFSTETMPAFLSFHAEIYGALTGDQIELLKQSACLLNHFGADSARGLGFCKYRLEAQA